MGLLKRDLPADHFQRLSQGLNTVQLADGILTLAVADRKAQTWLDFICANRSWDVLRK